MRSSHAFGLPGLRQFRNMVYSRYLGGVADMNVANGVIIRAAHSSQTATMQAGAGLRVGDLAEVDYSGGVTLGSKVTISEGARVFTHIHPIDGHRDWRKNPIEFSSLTVGDYVWIGANALVLPSVTEIGEGAVIAAGSVVSHNVKPYEVVGGVPAKHLRMRKIGEDET